MRQRRQAQEEAVAKALEERDEGSTPLVLHLSSYPSLQGALRSLPSSTGISGLGSLPRPLLGILFAAGWCDDCQAFVPLLERLLAYHQDQVRGPLQTHQQHQNAQSSEQRRSPLGDMAIVYVSSDRSAGEMGAFKPAGFDEVPFSELEQRCRLKLEVGVCAKKEVDDEDNRLRLLREPLRQDGGRVEIVAGLTASRRKHGIPTLVLVEAATGRVLTDQAAEHINQAFQEHGSSEAAACQSVLELWGGLARAAAQLRPTPRPQ
jgi:hypothetical protein